MTDILEQLEDPRNAGHLNRAAAEEIRRLRDIVDALDKTEDNQTIYPGREIFYLNWGYVASYIAGGGDVTLGLYGTREAAEAAGEEE